ncbi:MAG: aldo/keto reductase [Bryobacteraceae bacterium]|nr:aldo/keto reductase [Bryobacteraceae bacterium]
MLNGKATPEGTARYTSRFPALRAAGFYREAGGRHLSNLGLGTYLGDLNDETDRAYAEAVLGAVRGGINVIDTAINYRHQRSERSIGLALAELQELEEIQRAEFLVCTKAGFLVPEAIPAHVLQDNDVVGGMHSMAPAFLADQIGRSLENLGLDTIDVFYLHNPETQLGFVTREEFLARVRLAFELLEQMVAEGKIAGYGTATWEGYRKPGALQLPELREIAKGIAGDQHNFRWIQLPFNLGMTEAFTLKTQREGERSLTVLEAAEEAEVTVVASASLLQARLASNLPEELAQRLAGASTDAQRAIQFTRSTPGVTTALVGMSRTEHVEENLGVASFSPLSPEAYQALYRG